MTPDQRALGERVMEHCIHHPEQHRQAEYGRRADCGTVACIGGWTVILAPLDTEAVWFDGTLYAVRLSDRRLLTVDIAAQELLGLDDDQARKLFFELDEPLSLAYLRELLDAAPVAEVAG